MSRDLCIERLEEYKSKSHIVPIEVRGDQFESGWIQGWTACRNAIREDRIRAWDEAVARSGDTTSKDALDELNSMNISPIDLFMMNHQPLIGLYQMKTDSMFESMKKALAEKDYKDEDR